MKNINWYYLAPWIVTALLAISAPLWGFALAIVLLTFIGIPFKTK